ncbi:hypothetical protein BT63DRAFT_455102 [Microthyrium microscopicum]|uniref:Protein kinase domain-containing protein n=1 Tax=Microthyrium microscopicum TaxID=703497 RepID=A0A6A6UCF4_9PEZI|nr:hypothetical protein BT63DRAFT_455102 [Microthyrium microscopicum]
MAEIPEFEVNFRNAGKLENREFGLHDLEEQLSMAYEKANNEYDRDGRQRNTDVLDDPFYLGIDIGKYEDKQRPGVFRFLKSRKLQPHYTPRGYHVPALRGVPGSLNHFPPEFLFRALVFDKALDENRRTELAIPHVYQFDINKGDRSYTNYEWCEGEDGQRLIERCQRALGTKGLPHLLVEHIALHLILVVIYLESGDQYNFQAGDFIPYQGSNSDDAWIPLVHREIKPENVFFRYASARDNTGLPRPILGSLNSLIPEQKMLLPVEWALINMTTTVNGQEVPIATSSTFNKSKATDQEYIPPEYANGEHEQYIVHALLSVNKWQLGATIFEFVTGEKAMKYDYAEIKDMLKSSGLARKWGQLLIFLLNPDEKMREKTVNTEFLKSSAKLLLKKRIYDKQSIEQREWDDIVSLFPDLPRDGLPAGPPIAIPQVPTDPLIEIKKKQPAPFQKLVRRSSDAMKRTVQKVKRRLSFTPPKIELQGGRLVAKQPKILKPPAYLRPATAPDGPRGNGETAYPLLLQKGHLPHQQTLLLPHKEFSHRTTLYKHTTQHLGTHHTSIIMPFSTENNMSDKKSFSKRLLSKIPDLRSDEMKQRDQRAYERAVEEGRMEHWKELLTNDMKRRESQSSSGS